MDENLAASVGLGAGRDGCECFRSSWSEISEGQCRVGYWLEDDGKVSCDQNGHRRSAALLWRTAMELTSVAGFAQIAEVSEDRCNAFSLQILFGFRVFVRFNGDVEQVGIRLEPAFFEFAFDQWWQTCHATVYR